ncbi:MAG: hypothetical protein Q9209_000592 [Squamulea sp. 1 TL-2023]
MTPAHFLPGQQAGSFETQFGISSRPSIWGPAASQIPYSVQSEVSNVCVKDENHLMELPELKLGSLTLETSDEMNELDICTADDCPLKGMVHNKGLFLDNATLRFGVRFHEDFGFSNPPAFVWAAHFRSTKHLLRESEDYKRAVDKLTPDVLLFHPFDDPRDDDPWIVMNFMLHHAVIFQQKNGSPVEAQFLGKNLSGKESSVITGMNALTL